jgi:hypothetical protein
MGSSTDKPVGISVRSIGFKTTVCSSDARRSIPAENSVSYLGGSFDDWLIILILILGIEFKY